MPDMSITVSAPYFMTRSAIDKLLAQKEDWIIEQQLIYQSRQRERSLSFENRYFYLGKEYELEKRLHQKQIVELDDKLYVASSNKRLIRTYITSWYKQQARKIITERVYYYSRLFGLSFNTISLTSAKTRWGSCSSEKNLFFNWKLIMAPMPVLDYVVSHELAHLVEPNHSRNFWETVRKMSPLYREHRTWLKRYGHTLSVADVS